MTKAAAFRQADVTRTLKSVAAAGVQVAKVVIHPGSGCIEIIMGTPAANQGGANEWDEVLK